jgi:hypothetical protein
MRREYGKGGNVAICSIYWQVLRVIGGRRQARRASRIFRVSCRGAAVAGLHLMAALAGANLALAQSPTISEVTITGTNAHLAVAIGGTGFGTFPTALPCMNCTTPYLNITDGRGYGCQLFNITTWTETAIAFSGFQGNPGDNVLVLVTNPQNSLVGGEQTSVPKSIVLATPTIKSVSFSPPIGENLEMTIIGAGFGAMAPPGVPGTGDLPFFSFVDKPFDQKGEWQAGYGEDMITLKYGLWSPNRIVIVGFGGTYGTNGAKVHPNDPVEIAVANSGTCGLNVNTVNVALGPTSIGAVWGGHLP